MDKIYGFGEGNIKEDFYAKEDFELENTNDKATEFDSEWFKDCQLNWKK